MNALGFSGGRIPNKVRALWRGQHGDLFCQRQPTNAQVGKHEEGCCGWVVQHGLACMAGLHAGRFCTSAHPTIPRNETWAFFPSQFRRQCASPNHGRDQRETLGWARRGLNRRWITADDWPSFFSLLELQQKRLALGWLHDPG
jgi:hypothetical protein